MLTSVWLWAWRQQSQRLGWKKMDKFHQNFVTWSNKHLLSHSFQRSSNWSGLAKWFLLRVCHGVAVKVSAGTYGHLKAWMRLKRLLPRWLTHLSIDGMPQVPCWLLAECLRFSQYGSLHWVGSWLASYQAISEKKRERWANRRCSVLYNLIHSGIPLFLPYLYWSFRQTLYSVEGMTQRYEYQEVGPIEGHLGGWCG